MATLGQPKKAESCCQSLGPKRTLRRILYQINNENKDVDGLLLLFIYYLPLLDFTSNQPHRFLYLPTRLQFKSINHYVQPSMILKSHNKSMTITLKFEIILIAHSPNPGCNPHFFPSNICVKIFPKCFYMKYFSIFFAEQYPV